MYLMPYTSVEHHLLVSYREMGPWFVLFWTVELFRIHAGSTALMSVSRSTTFDQTQMPQQLLDASSSFFISPLFYKEVPLRSMAVPQDRSGRGSSHTKSQHTEMQHQQHDLQKCSIKQSYPNTVALSRERASLTTFLMMPLNSVNIHKCV